MLVNDDPKKLKGLHLLKTGTIEAMLRDEGCFLLEWISMHFDFSTFKNSPLLISHWFTDDRVVFKLELMLSVVLSHHRLIITFVGSHSPEDDWQGYLYAVVIFVVALIQSVCLHQYFIRVMVVGMRLRTAVMSIVYKKVGQQWNQSSLVSDAHTFPG